MLELDYFAGSMVGSDDTALRQLLLVKIRSVRIPGTIVRLWPLVWLLSLASEALELALEVGLICTFVVTEPVD